MIYPHQFPVNISEYAALGRANEFPDLACCPICRAHKRLLRHGFYDRNAIEEAESYRIPICRLFCTDCGKTVSILPTFLLPYFQHAMEYMIGILLTYWRTSVSRCSRQLRRWYERRVYGKMTEIELFFRLEGHLSVWPLERKERAINMLTMIQALGKATFARRWWRHQINSFMAASLYHGARVAKTE